VVGRLAGLVIAAGLVVRTLVKAVDATVSTAAIGVSSPSGLEQYLNSQISLKNAKRGEAAYSTSP